MFCLLIICLISCNEEINVANNNEVKDVFYANYGKRIGISSINTLSDRFRIVFSSPLQEKYVFEIDRVNVGSQVVNYEYNLQSRFGKSNTYTIKGWVTRGYENDNITLQYDSLYNKFSIIRLANIEDNREMGKWFWNGGYYILEAVQDGEYYELYVNNFNQQAPFIIRDFFFYMRDICPEVIPIGDHPIYLDSIYKN